MEKQQADAWLASQRPSATEWRKWNRAWDRLARRGVCDHRGGQEYRRVTQDWVRAGKPGAIFRFIRQQANLGPHEDLSN